jgi:hypothetical protein
VEVLVRRWPRRVPEEEKIRAERNEIATLAQEVQSEIPAPLDSSTVRAFFMTYTMTHRSVPHSWRSGSLFR